MWLEECFAATTWQVAPRRELSTSALGGSLSRCVKNKQKSQNANVKKCKDLKVQLHQDYRLLPSASSSFEYKETLLCCTDGAKKYKGNRCRTGYLFKHFHMFVFESLSFILKPFSIRSNLQRKPLGLSRAFMKVISF